MPPKIGEGGQRQRFTQMSSRMPSPLTAATHTRAVRKRDRRTCKAIRKAAGGDHRARREVRKIGGWIVDHDGATATTIRLARMVIERALERCPHVDPALLARLDVAVDRIELHLEADRLRIRPDDLAEVRMIAAAVARQLVPQSL